VPPREVCDTRSQISSYRNQACFTHQMAIPFTSLSHLRKSELAPSNPATNPLDMPRP